MSYEKSAEIYDAIYTAKKDYAEEARMVHELIKEHTRAAGKSLLSVACGTGLHDQYLVKWYDIEGVDLSRAQLAIAQRRLPKVKYRQADMTSFDMGKRYNVVICLFSSIGHLLSLRELRKGISEMAKHLKPGGVLIVEPWVAPDKWQPGKVRADFVDEPKLKIARISRTIRRGRITSLEFHHLVGRPSGTEHFVENQKCALYTVEEHLDAFHRAGLEVWHDKKGLMGRGLFIGRASK